MSSLETAVILAAGMGSRLARFTRVVPKPLVPVGGTSLLERALARCQAAGLKRAVIATGYKAEVLRNRIGKSFHGFPIAYVHNPAHETTNNVTTVALLADVLGQGAILLEGDVLFSEGLLPALLQGGADSARWAVSPWRRELDGCRLIAGPDGRIRTLDILRTPTEPAPGWFKSVRILALPPEAGRRLAMAARACWDAGRTDIYYDLVMKDLFPSLPVLAVNVDVHPWMEVDDEADLLRAGKMAAGWRT